MTINELKRVAKVWNRRVDFKCGLSGVDEVAAYEEGGKYFLRICKCSCHIVAKKGKKNVYEVWNGTPVIKEFDNKNAANAYFKAVIKNGEWQKIR